MRDYYNHFDDDDTNDINADDARRWGSGYLKDHLEEDTYRYSFKGEATEQLPQVVDVYPVARQPRARGEGRARGRRRRALGVRIAAALTTAALLMGASAVMGANIAERRMAPILLQLESALATQAAQANLDMRSLQAVQSQMLLGDIGVGEAIPVGEFNPAGHILSLPQLFIGANPAVVAISTQTMGRNAFGRTVNRPAAGSGFLISSDGYIVTNNHVIENATSISVLLYNGTSHTASIVGRDSASDLAVLRIEASGLAYLSLADSDTLLVGEQVAAIGNPLGEFANSLTAGVLSALNREINIDGFPREMLQTDAAINNGNSGGPLINMQGQVVGVVTAKSGGLNVEGLGFAIPSNVVSYVVADLIADGYVRGRAVMGVQIGLVGTEGDQRIIVDSVIPGSGALDAGVLPGDIIISANNIEVRSFQELRTVLDTLSPSDSMPLRVLRNGNLVDLVVVLNEFRPSYE